MALLPLLLLLLLSAVACVAGETSWAEQYHFFTHDYYGELGVSQSADAAAIKAAYRERSLRFHPDRNTAESSTEMFQMVASAYEVLKDEAKRREYDEFLVSAGAFRPRYGQRRVPLNALAMVLVAALAALQYSSKALRRKRLLKAVTEYSDRYKAACREAEAAGLPPPTFSIDGAEPPRWLDTVIFTLPLLPLTLAEAASFWVPYFYKFNILGLEETQDVKDSVMRRRVSPALWAEIVKHREEQKAKEEEQAASRTKKGKFR